MNPFQKYITRQLTDKLKKRTIVVWYDYTGDFSPYIDALPKNDTETAIANAQIDKLEVNLAIFDGSFFKLRADVEPFVNMDQPDPMLIYLPKTERDRRGSVLMELEKAGFTYERRFKQLARNALKAIYTDGVIDDLLAAETVTYRNSWPARGMILKLKKRKL